MKNKINELLSGYKKNTLNYFQPNILSDAWNEEIFKNHNKEYGAYELRHNYKQNISRALAISFSSVILFFLITIFINRKESVIKYSDIIPILVKPEKIEFPSKEKTETKPMNSRKKDKTLFILKKDSTFEKLPLNQIKTDSGSEIGYDTTADNLKGNTKKPSFNKSNEKNIGQQKVDSVVTWVPEMPEFPGGTEALNKFISKNISTNNQWRENGNEGKVIYEFVIGKDGFIRNQKIIADGVKYGIAELNLSLFDKMPAWKPGRNNGHEVSVLMHLPIKLVKE